MGHPAKCAYPGFSERIGQLSPVEILNHLALVKTGRLDVCDSI